MRYFWRNFWTKENSLRLLTVIFSTTMSLRKFKLIQKQNTEILVSVWDWIVEDPNDDCTRLNNRFIGRNLFASTRPSSPPYRFERESCNVFRAQHSKESLQLYWSLQNTDDGAWWRHRRLFGVFQKSYNQHLDKRANFWDHSNWRWSCWTLTLGDLRLQE